MTEKKWTKYGGQKEFFKFKDIGDSLEGPWHGVEAGIKYDNDIGRIGDYAFSLSAALRDMRAIPLGTEVRIVFTGWGESKSGNRFKTFDMFTSGGDDTVAPAADKPEFKATESDVPF